ncbi:hypothetical protein DUNSADRAFT_10620 [Dunaliella salina]|uniref:Calmodulin-lysine N-methyltransferase n=1 Tax=Dunaliella salina TaxID=3046 RepID=A0ABQ7GEZ1_DUNSA|nr:hypothetical protein DUNSADRAFT_10620 [Dunaliella salina]|eukprot:KAF5833170.1 hypothetical protein DUNSADRAFT_10620 [Dunaliella salina]
MNTLSYWGKGAPSTRVPQSLQRPLLKHLCRADTGHSAGIEVELANDFRASFPETGSGLLWARSTGLKVWDGAKVLSQLLLRPTLDDVVAKAPSFHGNLQDESSKCSSSSADGCLFSLEDRMVVELGAGLGLCSVAAAHKGAQVVATDGDADLVRLLKKNLAFNNGEVALTATRLRERKKQSAVEAGQQLPSNSHSSTEDLSTQGRFRHPPQAFLLRWGQEQAVAELKGQLLRIRESGRQAQQAAAKKAVSSPSSAPQQQQQQLPQDSYRDGAPDVVLLAEVVYGSDPGVWQALISTLKSLCDARTLILQAESRRIEGVLYGEYWAMLEAEHFQVVELPLTELLGPDLGLGPETPEVQRKSSDDGSVLDHRHQSTNTTSQFPFLGQELEKQQCSCPHVRAWLMYRSQSDWGGQGVSS